MSTAGLTVLFFLPPVGFVLYLLFGQNYARQRMFAIEEREGPGVFREIFEENHTVSTGRHPARSPGSSHLPGEGRPARSAGPGRTS